MRIVCCVSHTDEPTIWASMATIARQQGVEFEKVRVVIGKSPMNNSFNAALDIAFQSDADLLLHTASDVLLAPEASQKLLEVFDPRENYLTVGRGYDAIHNRITSGGVWIFNMQVIADRFRFRNVFKQDLDFCDRVENATGLTRSYTLKDKALTYHHPVWTPSELFAKFLYSYPKNSESVRSRMERFLHECLTRNPGNKALLAGMMGLKMAQQQGAMSSAKDKDKIDQIFASSSQPLELEGTEYFTRHKFYASLAKSILDSREYCAYEDPAPNVPLIPWV